MSAQSSISMFNAKNLADSPEVPFEEVGSQSDVFQTQVVIHVAVSVCSPDNARSSEPMRAQARTESDQVLPQPSGTIARKCGVNHAERDS